MKIVVKHHPNPRMACAGYAMAFVGKWTISWTETESSVMYGEDHRTIEEDVCPVHVAIRLMHAEIERLGTDESTMTPEEVVLWEIMVGEQYGETKLRMPEKERAYVKGEIGEITEE